MARQPRASADRYNPKNDFAPKKRSPLSTSKVITRERSRSRSRSPSRNRSPCPRYRSPLRKTLASDAPPTNTRSRSRSTDTCLVNDTTTTSYYDVSPGNILSKENKAINTKKKKHEAVTARLPTLALTPEQPDQKRIHTQERPQFDKLDVSIREKIWTYLLPEARTIPIRLQLLPQFPRQPIRLSYEVTLGYTPSLPSGLKALLGTSRESRRIALGSYQRLLGETPTLKEQSPQEMLEEENRTAEEEARLKALIQTSTRLAGIKANALKHLQSHPTQQRRNFYFSPKHDTLLFSEEAFVQFCCEKGLINRLDNYITFPGSDIQRIMIRKQFGDYKDGIIMLLTRFSGLKFLGLCWDERGRNGRNVMGDEIRRYERWIESEWKKVERKRRREEGGRCVVKVYTKMEMDRLVERY